MSRPNIYPDLFSPQPLRPNGTIDQLLANNGAGGFANVTIEPLTNLQYDSGTGTLSTLPTATLYATVANLPDPISSPVEGSLAVVGTTN